MFAKSNLRSFSPSPARISLALVLTLLMVFPDLALAQEPATCTGNSYWTASGASLTTPIETFGAAVNSTSSGDVMYVIGGEDWTTPTTPVFQTQILHKLVSAVATTSSSTWTFHNDMWKGAAGTPVGFARDLCGVVNNNFLYTIGGVIKDSSITNVDGNSTAQVWYAPINTTNGNLGAWKQANSVPVPQGAMGLQLHGSAVVTVGGNTYLYVIGGSNSDHGDGTVNQGITNAVHFAKINTDGSLALWDHDGNGNAVTLPPVPSQGNGLYKTCPVVHNGSIYVAGGESEGMSLNQVVYATPIANGTFSGNAWNNTTSNYMTTPDAAQAVVYNNGIILMGGDEGNNSITSSVFKGTVATNGSVTWGTLTSLPLAISRNAGATSGGHTFSLAGQNAGNDLTCIYYH
jgi:hypothetical protein